MTVDSFTIGAKGGGADVEVDDKYVSNLHAQVTSDGFGNFQVHDLGSTNGTFIRVHGMDRRIYAPTTVEVGQPIRVGTTHIPWWGMGPESMQRVPYPRVPAQKEVPHGSVA